MESTTDTPVVTVIDPPIVGSSCEECKTLEGIECITSILIGCNTGILYKIQDTSTGDFITGATGTTVNIYLNEGTVVVPSGGQPENCFTFGVGFAEQLIVGELDVMSAITCADIICSVTPTPSVSLTQTPTITPSVSLSPSITVTPSVTPSVSISPSVTPTPTITSSDPLCAGFGFDVTTTPLPPTPSISPTPSPTVSTYRTVSGETVVFVIDSGYFECGDIIKLEDCGNGENYYVNGPIFYNGNKLTINDIFTAELNGEEKCVKYIANTNGSSTHFLQNVSQTHIQCCSPSPTPTPSTSPTLTPTITPSVSTSVPARVGVSYVYTSCTTNDMVVQTDEVSYVSSGQTFINSDSSCWYYVGYFTNPYHPPTGFRVTNYSGNYFTNPPLTNIFDNCEDCLSSGNRYLTPTPSISITATPSVTPSITPTISITPSITPTISITPSITPTISITATPSVTPSITPTISVTPSITPTISITPSTTISITPSITPTTSNPYYLVCDSEFNTYTLECISDFINTTPTPTPTTSDTNINLPITPTPSLTVTPSITPSLTTGDKTIYVYYPNL
jgi:hypothetical protein